MTNEDSKELASAIRSYSIAKARRKEAEKQVYESKISETIEESRLVAIMRQLPSGLVVSGNFAYRVRHENEQLRIEEIPIAAWEDGSVPENEVN